jgi:hypothetical protein
MLGWAAAAGVPTCMARYRNKGLGTCCCAAPLIIAGEAAAAAACRATTATASCANMVAE